MKTFEPNYVNILDAARNRKPARVPLYEHGYHPTVMEEILGKPFWQLLWEGDYADKVEGYRRFCEFGTKCGNDCDSGRVWRHVRGPGRLGAVRTRAPAPDSRHGRYRAVSLGTNCPTSSSASSISTTGALAEALPPGMKAIGGIGNGIFETTQDFVPLMELSIMMFEQPDTYALLWQKVGDLFAKLWAWFLEHHADAFAVCRMGDRSRISQPPPCCRRTIFARMSSRSTSASSRPGACEGEAFPAPQLRQGIRCDGRHHRHRRHRRETLQRRRHRADQGMARSIQRPNRHLRRC